MAVDIYKKRALVHALRSVIQDVVESFEQKYAAKVNMIQVQIDNEAMNRPGKSDIAIQCVIDGMDFRIYKIIGIGANIPEQKLDLSDSPSNTIFDALDVARQMVASKMITQSSKTAVAGDFIETTTTLVGSSNIEKQVGFVKGRFNNDDWQTMARVWNE